jgi:hypothetical protein
MLPEPQVCPDSTVIQKNVFWAFILALRSLASRKGYQFVGTNSEAVECILSVKTKHLTLTLRLRIPRRGDLSSLSLLIGRQRAFAADLSAAFDSGTSCD